MIQAILTAISISLYQTFGEDYEIYKEEVKQDLEEPCFFISCLQSTRKPLLGNRYLQINPFCIQYFPRSKEKGREECNKVAEQMFWCLEWISIGDLILRGTQMWHKVDEEEAILHFFVNYDNLLWKKQEEVKMETYQTKMKLKGGTEFGTKTRKGSKERKP